MKNRKTRSWMKKEKVYDKRVISDLCEKVKGNQSGNLDICLKSSLY